MIRRGFTVVELLIIITIMGILLTLAVVNLNTTQANGRDSERKTDVENIALHLESYYRNQNPDLFFSGGGTYLGSDLIDDSSLKTHLPDIDMKSTRAPGKSTNDPTSLRAATNTDTTEAGIAPQPSKSNDIYVYQPLTANGGPCTLPLAGNDCRRFNIYYFEESSNSVKKITSKNQ